MRISLPQTKALCSLVCLLFFFASFSQRDYKKEVDSLNLLAQQKSGREKAEILSRISLTYLDYLDDIENSLRIIRQAIAIAQKEKRGLLLADCYCTLGRIKAEQEQPDSAIYFFSQSLNIIPKNSSVQNVQSGVAYSSYESCKLAAQVFANFGNAYRKKLNLSKSADYYLRALRTYDLARDTVVSRLVYHVNSKGEKVTREQASVKWAQDYLEQHADDKEAARICEEGAQMLSGIRWTLLDLGDLFEKTKDYSQALLYLKKAERNAEEVQSRESHLRILISIGSVYSKKKDYDSAVMYFHKMCDRALQLRIPQAMLEGHIKAGAAYSAAGNTEKALGEYQKIDEILRPINDGSYKTNSLYAQMPEKAVLAGVFNFRKAINHGLIGDIYHQTGKENDAIENYRAAIDLMKPLLDNKAAMQDTLDYMRVLWLMGSNYSKTSDHARAIKYFGNAELLFSKLKSADEQVSFLKSLYEAYDRKGDDKKAYVAYRKYISLRDSIQTLQNAGEVAQLQKRFEVEKKDADIELLSKARETQEAEIEKQKLVRNGFIIGSVIFLILAIIIFRSLQQNRKAKKIIEEQKSEVEHKNKEITDSIRYARRIQSAMMPTKDYLEKSVNRLQKK